MRDLIETLKEMNEAHLEACDASVWGGDAAVILSGPLGRQTRDAMNRFAGLYDKLLLTLSKLENAE